MEDFTEKKAGTFRKQQKMQRMVQYDPRPSSVSVHNPSLLENMRVLLLQCTPPPAFLQLLVAPEHVAMHDHDYSSQDGVLQQPASTLAGVTLEQEEFSDVRNMLACALPPAFSKESLNVTASERVDIEAGTREQARSTLWHLVRARRITGSTCGKILCQQHPTPALLKSVLYRKPFERLPPPIKWGIENELKANQEYLRYSRNNGKTRLTTQKCGFIIHPTMGWFGASPDALVTDPDSELPQGIAEFKCPYSKRELTPQEACRDPTFLLFSRQ